MLSCSRVPGAPWAKHMDGMNGKSFHPVSCLYNQWRELHQEGSRVFFLVILHARSTEHAKHDSANPTPNRNPSKRFYVISSCLCLRPGGLFYLQSILSWPECRILFSVASLYVYPFPGPSPCLKENVNCSVGTWISVLYRCVCNLEELVLSFWFSELDNIMEQELISPEWMYFKNEIAIRVSKKESFFLK